MEAIYSLLVLQLVFLIYQSVVVRNLKRSVHKAQDKAISVIKKNDARLHELYVSLEERLSFRKLPLPLREVPLADEQGVILSVKKIEVPGIAAPYNAALLKRDGGYHLFFRFDTPLGSREKAAYHSQIGCVELESDFTVCERTLFTVDTGSPFSEDARAFVHEGKPYLLFNDIDSRAPRALRLAALDLSNRRLESSLSLVGRFGQVEKNWTPFSHEGELHFLHTISPQKILKLVDLHKGLLEPIISSATDLCSFWSDKWGILRGGTPAQLVGDRYLAFFHSSFEDPQGIRWYIMGAYTFAASPPFQILQISPYPIIFSGLYSTPVLHAAHLGIRSIYPVGFVYEEQKGAIHVSCGENDSSICILTMDAKKLFSSFVNV